MSNKIPNIFDFILEVKSIDNCITYFNENISQENKEEIKEKKFKINNKDFLNIAKPFFNEKSKPAKVLGNLYLPAFDREFKKNLSENLKEVEIRDLIHQRMFELTEQNIIHLFRLFVLPLFIKCFLPLTYLENSSSLLYNQTELDKNMKDWKKIIEYKYISIPFGLNHIATLIIEKDNNKFSKSDICIIEKFKEYLTELKKKDLIKLSVYFEYARIEVNFLEKHISKIIDNIIKGSTIVMIDRIEINYMIMIKFFFILFLIDNFGLFIHLRKFFIEIQTKCNFDNLYILYYKLKYIEEKLSSKNTNAQQFYTSVYDYLVYKLYLHIQEKVEPIILKIIRDFELNYTFVDALIRKQLAEEKLANELKRQPSVNNRPPVNNNIQSNNNNITVSIENTSLNNMLSILNKKLEKIKKKMINKNLSLNNEMRNKIKNIDDTYSLIVLLKNEYQNEYKDKKKILKKILHLLKKNFPNLRDNNINSVKKISDLFNKKPSRKIFNLKKVFNYLIDVFHITNEDIIEAINSEKQPPHYNNLPPPYSNNNNYPILQFRPKQYHPQKN
jgi:hypothetical protein